MIKFLEVFLLSLILTFGPVMGLNTERVFAQSPSLTEQVCYHQATFVYQVAILRDTGVSREKVIAQIPDYKENKKEIDAVLEYIFVKYKDVAPEPLAQSYYRNCIRVPFDKSLL